VSRSIKIICLVLALIMLSFKGFCKHIKGGEIHYTYLGPSPTQPGYDRYELRLRLFISCQSTTGQLETSVILGIYRTSDAGLVDNVEALLSRSQLISLTSPSPCIVHPTAVCYWIREFTVIEELPKDPDGYMVIFQRCCRIDGIENIVPNVNVGASYFCQIQGTNSIGTTGVNSNPDFGIKDTVLICQGKRFRLDYSAVDADGDSLSYEFAPGYYGGGQNNAIVTNPPPPSSWVELGYASPFNGLNPLGKNVSIDRKTGVISGVAPAGGDYVVCVLVKEYRAGLLVSAHRKDFIISIDDKCDFPSADLAPNYITCNGFDFSFHNVAATTPLVHNYYWDFGVPGSTTDTSTLAKPTFTFPDTGVYTVRFYVNKDEPCTDSASTQMSVFPGFFPGFASLGSCILNPVLFKDSTKTKYGKVSSWFWNFGDNNTAGDSSMLQNPSYQYSDTGAKTITLVVANSKGCLDSISQVINITDKPPISFPFRDTLICSIDTLQLHAVGYGNFTWTPSGNIINPNTADPSVYPKTTTYYTVTLDQSGCVNSDSLRVRVVDRVTLYPGNDSTICAGDTILLNPSGDALYFKWSPAGSILGDANIKNPAISPVSNTTYAVIASIGNCFATGSVNIKTVPYPVSNAGSDATICWMDTARLNATAIGSRYIWLPAAYLSNPKILNPLAYPVATTVYQLLVYDTLGCPKPGISNVAITVNPQIIAFAGNDTSIVIGQPLQLHGSGAPSFLWYPNFALDRNDIADPMAILSQNQTYVMKTFTEEGCFAYDTVNIKVFTTAPDIFVPNAFTPDNNSNNIFRPIPVGISKIEYFRVYNRNGALVYSTSHIGSGWDGSFDGKPQPVGGYVWMVQGTDYTGKIVSKKGVAVLIR
jgi:gliding motility-associated-like protein